jgi:hypothetical protein
MTFVDAANQQLAVGIAAADVGVSPEQSEAIRCGDHEGESDGAAPDWHP